MCSVKVNFQFFLTNFQFFLDKKDKNDSYAKKKFEPKVMLWIAMSPKGVSTPVLTSGRSMAVNARSYVDNCLEPHLIPFLNTNYPRGGYVFWPDKATLQYQIDGGGGR